MFGHVVVKCNFIVAVSKLEQSTCLITWVYLGQKLNLDKLPLITSYLIWISSSLSRCSDITSQSMY